MAPYCTNMNDSSDWALIMQLKFTLRFIKFNDGFNRVRGFIETPEWLKKRKATINIQNKDDNCFLKCIYRYFNRDNENRHNYRDISMELVNEFLDERGISIAIFKDGITAEVLRMFEKMTNIGINFST
jgi:hypothetical protein